jgi:predicted HTH transcriptional regulator
MVRNELLDLIIEHPGKTTKELREMTDHSMGAIHKGLVDLMNEGKIAGEKKDTRFEWRAVKNVA